MKILDDAPVKKAFWRLLPLLVICYFVAYLDRANVGFVAVHMSRDIGLTASASGFGAGLFFLTYFLLEVPSNLLLARYGARRWIARILFTWGATSGAMAFVTNETGFYTQGRLLGAAEAGFFPGITYFVTLWFPAADRARITAFFLCAAPVSLSLGGPLSGALLGLDGLLGVPGWRWMFIIEALPAMVLSLVVLRYLTDRPSDAAWLTPAERKEFGERLAIDAQQNPRTQHHNLYQALFNFRVLLLGVANFSTVVAAFGVSFFLPRIIKEFGLSDPQTGFLSAVPYALAAICLVWWGKRWDARLERRYHTLIPIVFASMGPAAAAPLTESNRANDCIQLCGNWVLGRHAGVLVVVFRKHSKQERGGRYCRHQRHCQPRRVRGAVHYGLFPGSHWRLRGWPAGVGRRESRRGGDRGTDQQRAHVRG